MPIDTTAEEKTGVPLAGIGGWLLFFIVRLLLGVAQDALQLLAGKFSGVVQSVTVGLAVLAGLAAILLMAGKRAGVLIGKISMLADAAISLFGAVGGLIAGSEKTGRIFMEFLVDIAFFFYLSQSVRVKNTYFAKSADRNPK